MILKQLNLRTILLRGCCALGVIALAVGAYAVPVKPSGEARVFKGERPGSVAPEGDDVTPVASDEPAEVTEAVAETVTVAALTPTAPPAASAVDAENDELSRALIARLEFEALSLQLIGVATFGDQTTGFVKHPGSPAPMAYQVGDKIADYRIAAIETDRMAMEKGGVRFWLGLGVPGQDEDFDEPTLAEDLEQELNDLMAEDAMMSADAEMAKAIAEEVKGAASALKEKTSKFETAKVIEDGWNVPGVAVSRGRMFDWPMRGRITSSYGYRRHPMGGGSKMHNGIDIAAPYGTPIRAAADGVVSKVGRNYLLGRYVYIRHSGGYETRYGHLHSYSVKAGQRVTQGDIIGKEGSSGRSTGPHLHFEIRHNGRAINPAPYLR